MSDKKTNSKSCSAKQWFQRSFKRMKHHICKCFRIIVKAMPYIVASRVFLKLVGFILRVLYEFLPFLIEVCDFLENLASSLSYKRKGFFYGLY